MEYNSFKFHSTKFTKHMVVKYSTTVIPRVLRLTVNYSRKFSYNQGRQHRKVFEISNNSYSMKHKEGRSQNYLFFQKPYSFLQQRVLLLRIFESFFNIFICSDKGEMGSNRFISGIYRAWSHGVSSLGFFMIQYADIIFYKCIHGSYFQGKENTSISLNK